MSSVAGRQQQPAKQSRIQLAGVSAGGSTAAEGYGTGARTGVSGYVVVPETVDGTASQGGELPAEPLLLNETDDRDAAGRLCAFLCGGCFQYMDWRAAPLDFT